MSEKYSYLDISIRVYDADGNHSSLGTGADIALPDLSGVAANFMSLGDGYLMWTDATYRYYSYFLLSADGQRLTMSVTAGMPRSVLLQGRSIVTLLGSVKSRVKESETLTDQLLDRLAGEAGFPEHPLMAPEPEEAQVASEAMLGCRTYNSNAELGNIFGFPRQRVYGKYGAIVIVPSTVLTVEDSTLPQINEPIDKALTVVAPEGVDVSETRVEFSDHLSVTYNCDGFDPVSVMFEVGTTNRYVRINGPALVVNTALHAGIIFHKRIPYTVTSLGGMPIDTYTILINGRTANRTDDGFEVSNTDFLEENTAKITVSSTNFSTYTATFTPQQLAAAAPLDIVLEPESREILLRLDFGGGRIVEEILNIEKNTPEYCQLRAGRFHGFRAHRLMGSTPETYNIDVRPSGEAVAPQAAPAAPTQSHIFAGQPIEMAPAAPQQPEPQPEAKQPSGPVAPVIEKAPTAIWNEEKPQRHAPEFENETRGEQSEGTSKAPRIKINFGKVTMAVVTVGLAILAIWYLASLFGRGGETEAAADSLEQIQVLQDTETPAAQTAQQTAAPAQASNLSADDQADITYLNDNSKWRSENLKSQAAIQLFEAMKNGNVDAIASSDYFAIEGRCTNRQAQKLVDMLWAGKGSPQARKQARLLREGTEKGTADLHDLVERIARCQPLDSEKNTQPRPKK